MNNSILFVTSQLYPFNTSSMGVFNYSLPRRLREQGWDARVIAPKYNNPAKAFPSGGTVVSVLNVKMDNTDRRFTVEYCIYDGIPMYFINQSHYFGRDNLYGYEDEPERFIFMCKAVLEALPHLGCKPQVLHCQDWHTGFIPLLIKSKYSASDFYKGIPTVFTIHNLGYQGVYDSENSIFLDMDMDTLSTYGVDHYDHISFMKAGIMYADLITTVSPTYAREILTEEFGLTLNRTIYSRRKDLYGILCGLDFEMNNPSTDKRLFANYNADNLEGKHINKTGLQKLLNLPVRKDVPVISLFSRLTSEKGIDLVREAMDDLMKNDVQLIVVSNGFEIHEEYFRKAQEVYPQKFAFRLYHNDLAYKAYAGSDIFLMPSRFEPCGIGQLIALRYGTVPVVRQVGGLNDSIHAYNEETREGNGFTFKPYNSKVMLYTIRNALQCYYRKDVWNRIVKNGMLEDHSWDKYVGQYIEVYNKIL